MDKLFDQPCFAITAAPPRAGKSHFTSYLLISLHQQKKYDYAFVFSPTGRKSFKFMPKNFIFPVFRPAKLVQIMRAAKACMDIEENGGPRAPRILIVFDDCLGAAHFSSGLFLQLASTYRHYNISVVLNTQYIAKMPTTFREMATYIFMLRQNTDLAFKHLFDTCGGRTLFKKLDKWIEFINERTLDRGILICKMEEPQTTIAQRFTIFKAPAEIPKLELNFEQ
jgi:hypothetical protein